MLFFASVCWCSLWAAAAAATKTATFEVAIKTDDTSDTSHTVNSPPDPAPWTQLFGLSGGWLPGDNFSLSLSRVATAGDHSVRGRVLEQGNSGTGKVQAQALSAFDHKRGLLSALLEDGILSGVALRTHLVRWSVQTGSVVDSCMAPLMPNDFVGAGQYIAIDEAENRALLIGRDKRHGLGSATDLRPWT